MKFFTALGIIAGVVFASCLLRILAIAVLAFLHYVALTLLTNWNELQTFGMSVALSIIEVIILALVFDFAEVIEEQFFERKKRK